MDAVAPLGYAPDRAIRARLSAIFIDGLLIGTVSRVAIPALGIHAVGSATLAVLFIQFAYFFAFEAGRGQTIGKRAMNLHVVRLDGKPLTPRESAIRNALRFVDALPLLYASGLVSVMWTGPGKRQRIGDRVAETTVILERGGKPRVTPGWLLPTLTVASVLLSVVLYGVIYDEVRTPDVAAEAIAPVLPPGFAGDNSQAPAPGSYQAHASFNGGSVTDPRTPEPLVRHWEIAKTCSTQAACTYAITREVPGGSEAGRLVPGADGWRVTFPTKAFRDRCPGRSGLITVWHRSSFVFQFGAGTAQARERTRYSTKDCGELTQALDWVAALARF